MSPSFCFASQHENRLPEEDDTDNQDGKKKHKLVWNRFKWTLFLANTVVRSPSLHGFRPFQTLSWLILALLHSLTADGVLDRGSHLLPAGLVQHLDRRRYHPSRQQRRAHPYVPFSISSSLSPSVAADTLALLLRGSASVSTLAASFCLLTSLIGYAGVLLNNRSFLAVFTFLCWICFALIVIPGYLAYKRFAFNLEGKINRQWSRDLGTDGRLRIQNQVRPSLLNTSTGLTNADLKLFLYLCAAQLRCCGYYSPFVEATVSATCYSRSNLSGCKGRFLRFERQVLKRFYVCAFSLVPVQIAIIIAGLLCSNHVTYRFTKGLTPKQYRLNLDSLAYVMDGYAG